MAASLMYIADQKLWAGMMYLYVMICVMLHHIRYRRHCYCYNCCYISVVVFCCIHSLWRWVLVITLQYSVWGITANWKLKLCS